MRNSAICLSVLIFLVAWAGSARAHVPYLEVGDYTYDNPFQVRKSVEQSIAVYSWLDFDFPDFHSTNIDTYAFTLTEPAEIFLQSIVPACQGYEDFAPWFALVGPGLPEPTEDYPFFVPPGDGVIVTPYEVEHPRPTFYEPFGNQVYFDGPVFNQTISQPGDYLVYYWDPNEMGGDYCAIIGDKEIWQLDDILMALINTPLIRQKKELHITCLPPGTDDDTVPPDDDTMPPDDDVTPPDDDNDNDDNDNGDDDSAGDDDDNGGDDGGCGN